MVLMFFCVFLMAFRGFGRISLDFCQICFFVGVSWFFVFFMDFCSIGVFSCFCVFFCRFFVFFNGVSCF